jgi:hypothetical protein
VIRRQDGHVVRRQDGHVVVLEQLVHVRRRYEDS